MLAGLWYANGVTLAHDEQSVLVVETLGFRVVQHWIAGPKTGISTTLIDHLYGNFDIILDHVSAYFSAPPHSHHPTPHALCAAFYLVPRLTSC